MRETIVQFLKIPFVGAAVLILFSVVLYVATIGIACISTVTPNLAVPVYPAWWMLLIGSACGIGATFALANLCSRINWVACILKFIGCNSLCFFLLEGHATSFILPVLQRYVGGISANPMAVQWPGALVLLLIVLNLMIISCVVPILMEGLKCFKAGISSKWQRRRKLDFGLRRGRRRVVLAVVCAIVGIGFSLFGSLRYGNQKVYVENISYQYAADCLGKEFCWAVDNIEKATLRLDLSVSAIRSPYDNVFQTADINNGIRLEINADGNAGVVFPSDTTDNGLDVVQLGILISGRNYSVAVEYCRNRVSASIDGVNKGVRACRSPLFDRIVLGRGFDETRIFHGRISNGSVLVEGISDSLMKIKKGAVAIGELFLVLALFLLCACVRTECTEGVLCTSRS